MNYLNRAFKERSQAQWVVNLTLFVPVFAGAPHGVWRLSSTGERIHRPHGIARLPHFKCTSAISTQRKSLTSPRGWDGKALHP